MIATGFRPDWPAPPSVNALITTRRGGCSASPFDQLNLGDHVGDAPEAVAANRALLQSELPAAPHWLQQVHGTNVVDPNQTQERRADAAVTHVPGTVLAVLTADCLPVLLADERGGAVGIAHAGWRGLAAGVVEAAVRALAVEPRRLLAYLGPAISGAHYEVGDDVYAAFGRPRTTGFRAHAHGKFFCDLYELTRERLRMIGVTRVFGGAFCTYRDRDRFYSFRRDGPTGRMASLIWIR